MYAHTHRHMLLIGYKSLEVRHSLISLKPIIVPYIWMALSMLGANGAKIGAEGSAHLLRPLSQ